MRQIISFSFILFLSFNAFSQSNEGESLSDWEPAIYQVGKIYPGYIIKNDGDTIKGFLKAGNRCASIGSSNQNLALFFLDKTDKKPAAKYKPGDIKGYKIADKVYESINYSGGLLKRPNFNLVVRDGAIRTYEWYAQTENYSSIRQQSGESWKAYDARRFETKLIIAKEPTEPIEASMLGLSFAKRMPDLIDDNPEMAEKVANKEQGYGFLRMFEVIEEYNKWAETNKK